MQISTKLFNERQVEQFSKLNKNVQTIQEKISTGQNILKASDDPVAAVNLSAAKEQQALLSRFEMNVGNAKQRLSLADGALQEVVNVLTRISELSVQAANGSYGPAERKAILAEAKQLAQVVVEIANTKDAQGQALFAGYKSNEAAFEMQPDGSIIYRGDRGVSALQISETMTVATSLDGGSVFERVDTGQGRKSIFDMLSSAISAIDPANDLATQGSAMGHAALKFDLPRDPQSWSFSLAGSKGTVQITASVAEGKYDDLIAAINQQSAASGVEAYFDAESQTVRLREPANGTIIMSDIEVEGVTTGTIGRGSSVLFSTIDGQGREIGDARRLGDSDLLIGSLASDLGKGIDHLSVQQAFIGAQMNKADRQLDVIMKRQVAVTEKVADISEADIAALVTELQAMILNRDAAQQAFAKIGQQSLFDFLR
jgi:flagellar hook-associated protein 3 FlgL